MSDPVRNADGLILNGVVYKHVRRLSGGEHGIIIGPRYVLSQSSFTINGPDHILSEDLRFYLLFWDRLLVPRNGVIESFIGDDAEFLRKAGVLWRSPESFLPDGGAGEIVQRAYAAAYCQLDHREAWRWTLGRSQDAGSLVADYEQQEHAIAVRLHHAIPVPGVEVPLDDVLEFRQRRLAEASALRSSIDEMAMRIAGDLAPDLAELREYSRMTRAIEDYLKASREWNGTLRLGSLTAKVKLDRAISLEKIGGAVGVADLAHLAGASPIVSLGAGFIAWAKGAVTVEPGFTSASKDAPYEYIVHVDQELWSRSV